MFTSFTLGFCIVTLYSVCNQNFVFHSGSLANPISEPRGVFPTFLGRLRKIIPRTSGLMLRIAPLINSHCDDASPKHDTLWLLKIVCETQMPLDGSKAQMPL